MARVVWLERSVSLDAGSIGATCDKEGIIIGGSATSARKARSVGGAGGKSASGVESAVGGDAALRATRTAPATKYDERYQEWARQWRWPAKLARACMP